MNGTAYSAFAKVGRIVARRKFSALNKKHLYTQHYDACGKHNDGKKCGFHRLCRFFTMQI